MYKRQQIDKENYLNEDTLNQGDNSFYDYCADISDEERKEEITNLVDVYKRQPLREQLAAMIIYHDGSSFC